MHVLVSLVLGSLHPDHSFFTFDFNTAVIPPSVTMQLYAVFTMCRGHLPTVLTAFCSGRELAHQAEGQSVPAPDYHAVTLSML